MTQVSVPDFSPCFQSHICNCLLNTCTLTVLQIQMSSLEFTIVNCGWKSVCPLISLILLMTWSFSHLLSLIFLNLSLTSPFLLSPMVNYLSGLIGSAITLFFTPCCSVSSPLPCSVCHHVIRLF